jgi:hypothetical protein
MGGRTSGTRKGNGPGHGGPAKGAGSKKSWAPPVDSSTPGFTLAADLNHDPQTQAYRQQQVALNRERRAIIRERTIALEDRLFNTAMGTILDATMVQITAGAKVHAIWNGLPTQRTENITTLTTKAPIDSSKLPAEQREVLHDILLNAPADKED